MQSALVKSALAATMAVSTLSQEYSRDLIDQLERDFAAKNEHLYVHIIPHSHDDVGWLKTVDEYFTGSRQDLQVANVENIIDTVVVELMADPAKRYT